MKLTNDLITSDTNDLLLSAIEKFKYDSSVGYVEYLENKVESEYQFYKGYIINASCIRSESRPLTIQDRINFLNKEYNAVIVAYIRGISEIG
jgi:hypothetical protein